jgi:DNA-binding CsgD family transcriptional regulator
MARHQNFAFVGRGRARSNRFRDARLQHALKHHIIFYAEDELTRRPGAPRPSQGAGLLHELLQAPNASARQDVWRAALRAAGFQWMAYGTITIERGVAHPLSFFSSYANPQWTERYFAERHHEVDLRHADACGADVPVVWDSDELGRRAASAGGTPRHRAFVEHLRACGMHSGVLMKVSSWTVPRAHAIVGLSAATAGSSWIGPDVLGRALVLALCMHELLSLHLQPAPASSAAPVSGLQQEILRALLQGLSDKEIASRLNISAHAIDYHMRQLRRRFGVHNRVQLLHAAALQGGALAA